MKTIKADFNYRKHVLKASLNKKNKHSKDK